MLDNVIFYSDRVLLGWLVGTGAVGVYAVGYDIADKALKSIMYSVGAAALPTAVRTLEQDGEAAARLQLEQNVTILVALGLPTTVGLCLVAPDLAGLVGAEFHDEAITLIPLIAIGTFLACLRSNYLDHAFHLGKRALPLTLVTAITAVVNVALNLLLIPIFGMLPEFGGITAALALKTGVGGIVYLAVAGLLKIGGIRDILPALRSRLAPSPQP
jgi:O-antigen/teichoic acid export membrane protein